MKVNSEKEVKGKRNRSEGKAGGREAWVEGDGSWEREGGREGGISGKVEREG